MGRPQSPAHRHDSAGDTGRPQAVLRPVLTFSYRVVLLRRPLASGLAALWPAAAQQAPRTLLALAHALVMGCLSSKPQQPAAAQPRTATAHVRPLRYRPPQPSPRGPVLRLTQPVRGSQRASQPPPPHCHQAPVCWQQQPEPPRRASELTAHPRAQEGPAAAPQPRPSIAASDTLTDPPDLGRTSTGALLDEVSDKWRRGVRIEAVYTLGKVLGKGGFATVRVGAFSPVLAPRAATRASQDSCCVTRSAALP